MDPNAEKEAYANLVKLRSQGYLGRGFIIGRDIMVYFLTGRSPDTRNRLIEVVDGEARTAIANPNEPHVPEPLAVYGAMLGSRNKHLIGNGIQTGEVFAAVKNNDAVHGSLGRSAFFGSTVILGYENDSSHTPRITGVLHLGNGSSFLAEIAINRKSLFDSTPEMEYFRLTSCPEGFGWCVTTYEHDGSPPPSFRSQPYLLPLDGGPSAVLARYWEALRPELRACVAVKNIDQRGEGTIIVKNARTKVG